MKFDGVLRHLSRIDIIALYPISWLNARILLIHQPSKEERANRDDVSQREDRRSESVDNTALEQALSELWQGHRDRMLIE